MPHLHVLLAEDEQSLATVVTNGLRERGFSVDTVHDGRDAVWRARETAYDVIVLDIMMPGLNGYDVVKAVREHDSQTPILMLTAKDGEWDQSDAFELGADDYLTKPFSFVVLIARLRALARRSGAGVDAPLRVGGLRLDSAQHRVHRADSEIDLTPREFALLEFFMRHPGQLLTKSQILDDVWDLPLADHGNIVEVYIGYLRRKIDTPFDLRTLETVRGVGYRLVADV
ncbi:response regulator transcription factor [Allobranchiibius sp. CTAmp26]|uniref:response regulator transcription factor n=1 Tax=Allobranchiibius sp. CTAmp26 TaxID=2815214 RepID=UPI001AA0F3DA|nr:response regulator transcription factor [Allobranchiibius sp. CTAmp26]MBO1754536.1 response regulator transcription factor [Allobranchiibius sp. CTAmp26]